MQGIPNIITSSSVPKSAVEKVETRKWKKEQTIVEKSTVSNVANESQNYFSTFEEFLVGMGNNNLLNNCITVKKTNSVVFIYLATKPSPKVVASAVVNKNLQLFFFVETDELTVGSKKNSSTNKQVL